MICTDRKMVHPDDKFSCLNKPLCRHILFLYMLYKIFAFSMCMLLHTLFLLSYIPFYSTGFFWFILFWRNKVNGMILEKYSWVTKYVTDPPIYHLLKNYQKKKVNKVFLHEKENLSSSEYSTSLSNNYTYKVWKASCRNANRYRHASFNPKSILTPTED